ARPPATSSRRCSSCCCCRSRSRSLVQAACRRRTPRSTPARVASAGMSKPPGGGQGNGGTGDCVTSRTIPHADISLGDGLANSMPRVTILELQRVIDEVINREYRRCKVARQYHKNQFAVWQSNHGDSGRVCRESTPCYNQNELYVVNT